MLVYVICERCNGSGEGVHETTQCPTCRGDGEVPAEACSICGEVVKRFHKDDICVDCYNELFSCKHCGE